MLSCKIQSLQYETKVPIEILNLNRNAQPHSSIRTESIKVSLDSRVLNQPIQPNLQIIDNK